MWGAGESEVILYPNGLVSIRIGKASGSLDEQAIRNGSAPITPEIVSRLGALS
jgi:hypothetical protein